MAVFEYAAISKAGKNVKGVIDADSAAAARRKLREQNLFPTKVEESSNVSEGGGKSSGAKAGGRIPGRDIALSTRQLAVLLQAGMPLVEAMGALLNQTANPRLRKIFFDVRDRVNEGKTLADSLAQHPKVFKGLYVNMVRAGEASGALEQVLLRLADVMERQVRLNKRVMSSLSYPIFLCLFGVAVIVFMMLVIVPKLMQLFERQKADLPFLTEMMIGLSNFLSGYWYLLLLAGASVVILWRAWVSRPEGRLKWDRFRLRAPLIGPLTTKVVCARFARTLGTMLQSGLTMMTGLEVVRSVAQNRVVEQAVDDIKAGVRRGQDLSQPMKASGIFPPLLIQMIELGQRSGELEAMLLKVSDTYEEDVELTVDALVALLEPVIIVFMAVFVGILVASILLPILELTNQIRG